MEERPMQHGAMRAMWRMEAEESPSSNRPSTRSPAPRIRFSIVILLSADERRCVHFSSNFRHGRSTGKTRTCDAPRDMSGTCPGTKSGHPTVAPTSNIEKT